MLNKQRTLKDLGVPSKLQEASFFTINQNRKHYDELLSYAANPSGFMFINGGNGAGKSYSACCVLAHFLKCSGEPYAYFFTLPELQRTFRESQYTPGEVENLLIKLKETHLLILDDLGLREPTPAFFDFLYTLIDHRCNDDQGTIFTSNFGEEEIGLAYGDAVRSRVFSGKVLVYSDEDRRQTMRDRDNVKPPEDIKGGEKYQHTINQSYGRGGL